MVSAAERTLERAALAFARGETESTPAARRKWTFEAKPLRVMWA
jgi:hypothetical protein